MGGEKERRVDLSESLGYIKGSLDALHPKIDLMQVDIKANSGRIGKVEKQISKYKHVLVGVGGAMSVAWTVVVAVWADAHKFIHHLFSGGNS